MHRVWVLEILIISAVKIKTTSILLKHHSCQPNMLMQNRSVKVGNSSFESLLPFLRAGYSVKELFEL